jgi:hypothetical protein
MSNSTQEQHVFTEQQMLEIMGINNESVFREEDVRRDPRTGRIVMGPDGPDDQLNVTFSTEAVFSKLETFLAKGVPKYVDMDFITIIPPGQAHSNVVHRPVTDFDMWRFGVEFDAFKKGKSEALIGTPLSLWGYLSPSQIKELETRGIRTIEQVAALSDGTQGIQSLQTLKVKAQQYLETAKDSTAAGALQAQLDERDASHKAELAAMQEQINQLIGLAQAGSEGKAAEKSKAANKKGD